MSENILIIGSYCPQGVDSFDWFQELPNISDYDTIILDTTRIFNFWSLAGRSEHFEGNIYFLKDISELDEKVKSNIHLVHEKLLEILEFDVNIYALYLPDINISAGLTHFDMSGDALEPFVDINAWCPISIDTVVEKGKTILMQDESYQEYFRDFKGWEYYFVPDSLEIREFEMHYHHKWKVTPRLEVIATNKVEKPVAVKFTPCFHMWTLDEEGKGWFQFPEKYGGSLTLLPTIDNTESLIEFLLQRGKEFEETPKPDWVNQIEVPGETSLKSKITTERQKLDAIETKIEELEASLSEIQKYKGLLYETGLSLQEVVKSTLEKFGAKIKPSIVTDEFIVEVNGKDALIEVKGNTKSITKDDVAQLVTDLMQHLKTTGQEIDGILVGNAWRLLAVENRDARNKPIFSRDAIRVAQNHNIGLISTTELFKAHCKIVKEPQYKRDILNKIISGKGVIKFNYSSD